jgi:hypothetical protein
MAKLTKQQCETLRRILADLEATEQLITENPADIVASLAQGTTDLARFIVLYS